MDDDPGLFCFSSLPPRTPSTRLIDQYSTLCSITGDLSKVGYTTGVGTDGQPFYRFGFDLVLLFGLTELKALLAWEEGGVEKRYFLQILDNHLLTRYCSAGVLRPLCITSVFFFSRLFHGLINSTTTMKFCSHTLQDSRANDQHSSPKYTSNRSPKSFSRPTRRPFS